MMKLLDLLSTFAKKEPKTKQQRCFRCGRSIVVHTDNLRVYEYCSSCK